MGMLLRSPPEENRGHTIKRVSTERLSKATWARSLQAAAYSVGAPALTNKVGLDHLPLPLAEEHRSYRKEGQQCQQEGHNERYQNNQRGLARRCLVHLP